MKVSRTVVGVNTAKRVVRLHRVDMETGEIVDLELTPGKFHEHFATALRRSTPAGGVRPQALVTFQTTLPTICASSARHS